MPEGPPAIIGIMADSHGDPVAIDNAAVYLRQRGCGAVYHLGDICDSNLWQTADDCVKQVREHGIVAIKGNNDHSLAADARGRSQTGLRPETLVFLDNLPLSLCVASAKLVHSRPFIRRLGLSSMIGMVGHREAADYFRKHPDGLLFRGHSHKPEMICGKTNEVRFTSLAVGQTIELAASRPCIVTCGALASGWVMVWEPGNDRLECASFS